MLKLTSYNSEQPENMVNHNISNINRPNRVGNANWVEV
jgi:hypothetical protein